MDKHLMFSQRTRFPLNTDLADFPFKRQLSLAPLVALWDDAAAGKGVRASLARVVNDALEEAPELREPIDDLGLLERHGELVGALMAKVFPPAFWEQEYAAALVPFTLRPFYATPSFERLLLGPDNLLRGQINLPEQAVRLGRILNAYDIILQSHYGLALGFEYPIVLTTTDPTSGLERHFGIRFDRRFLEAHPLSPVKRLTEDEQRRLLENRADPAVLMELIPPAGFVFRGFTVLHAADVTDQEVLSALKRDLIEKESIVSPARFQRLEGQLRTLFRRPDLRLGLAAIQGDQVLTLNYGCRLEHSCIFADSVHYKVSDFAGSIYDRAVALGQPLIIDDLATYGPRTAVDDAVLATGVRNVVVAPLYYQDQLIGTLELGSTHPGDLNPTNALKLREVLPLFSMAVRRSIDELNTRIQAVIKEKCTAIHPSVEWRFRQAVLNSFERRTGTVSGEMEPIVFKDVYPLYAISDIRGSSTERNAAIQADLLAHLGLARDVVALAREAKPLPILDELQYRIGKHITQIEHSLNSGDEVATLAFLRQHVEPLFDHMQGFGARVRERIQAYRTALDPHLGTVYRRRRDYEASVTLINETISSYLDAEQEMAQAMFPHYFEKQRTDGIDYGIYVGASLVESGVFDELYLRNLRLWQLMVTCGIARRTHALLDRLPVPLETTHLILVQHAPLAIRFRFDEKRFDVDGAYNVRYEVIKKRIDKAQRKGSSERVTQPGAIAVVYSHRGEAKEYGEYVDYLQAAGYLTSGLEELELEDVQGVHGLRALRVGVDLENGRAEPSGAAREAAAAVRAIAR
jgi:GAF domain